MWKNGTAAHRPFHTYIIIYTYVTPLCMSVYLYIHMHGRDPRRHTYSRWVGGFPLLLEPCDIIAFDLQINRESVHLLGGDGRCDGRAH